MNPLKISNAQRAIAGLVSLLIGKKSTIEWGQLAACKADGTILLPRPKTGDADEIALMTRMAVHEAGHEEHTDFDAFGDIDASTMALFNSLEDARIEREQTRVFPGAGLVLNRGLEETVRSLDAKLQPDQPSDTSRLVVVNVLIKAYRALVGHEALQSAADPLVAKGDTVLGPQGVQAVTNAIAKLSLCQNTADTYALAKELLADLQNQEPSSQEQGNDTQEQEQAADEEGEGSESTQSGDSEDSDSNGGSDGDSPSNADSPTDSNSDSGKQEEGDIDASGQASADHNSTSETGEPGDATENPKNSGAQDAQGQGEGTDADTHNQEGPGNPSPSGDEASGSGSGSGSAGNSAPSQPTPPKQKLDLSSAAGEDMGSLLKQAYAEKFGEPDVDKGGATAPSQTTTATDDLTSMVAQALKNASQNGAALEEAMDEVEQSVACTSMSGGSEKSSGTARTHASSANLNGAVSRLVRIFTKELQDKRKRNVKIAPAGGRIASNRIWRLNAVGDTNVFRLDTATCGIDAAVTVMLDRSGSMDMCIVEAAAAALACSQALERISKVRTSIEMFPGQYGEPGNTVTLQSFGQSARQVVRKASEVNAEGGTPLTEALQDAIPKLMAQRVKKRIVFIVTDGVPNNVVTAKEEMARAQALGVEFVGIGIGEYGKAIEGLMPCSVVVNAASELPDAFEKLFRGAVALKLAA
jgi:cobalamin biosynthesis protein CobT